MGITLVDIFLIKPKELQDSLLLYQHLQGYLDSAIGKSCTALRQPKNQSQSNFPAFKQLSKPTKEVNDPDSAQFQVQRDGSKGRRKSYFASNKNEMR